ncbi:MAG TPA: hypothetical protein VKO67_00190 [Smithellaceae bacterium]|nr:hypothetical protein [Smithellaceae bacterium]
MKHTLKLYFLMALTATLSLSWAGCDKENAALQEQCKNRCEAYFMKEFGDKVFDNKERAGSISYKSHYNRKMNSCFIVLDENGYERSADKLYEKKTLLAPADNKKYGFFYNIGTSTVCDVAGKKCRSEDEWDDLVKPYMKE